jgi:hypothetical protein
VELLHDILSYSYYRLVIRAVLGKSLGTFVRQVATAAKFERCRDRRSERQPRGGTVAATWASRSASATHLFELAEVQALSTVRPRIRILDAGDQDGRAEEILERR